MSERGHWTVHLDRVEFVRYWVRRGRSEAWGLGGWSFVVDHLWERENVNKLGKHNQSLVLTILPSTLLLNN